MSEITKDQRSEEWFEKRRQGITATDIVAIMREHPYKSVLDIYNDKVLPPRADPALGDPAVQWGMEHEPEAFDDISKLWPNDKLSKVGLMQSKDNPLFIASPDAVTDHGYIVEIKCPFNRELPNEPARHHVLQVQWQLLVMGWDQGFIVYWTPTGLNFHLVQADKELWKRMKNEALNFWEGNVLKKVPPQTKETKVEIDSTHPDHQAWERLSRQLATVSQRIEVLEDEKGKLRDEILKMADGKSIKAPGLSIYSQWRTSKNWKKACEDAGIQPYEGEPSKSIIVRSNKSTWE